MTCTMYILPKNDLRTSFKWHVYNLSITTCMIVVVNPPCRTHTACKLSLIQYSTQSTMWLFYSAMTCFFSVPSNIYFSVYLETLNGQKPVWKRLWVKKCAHRQKSLGKRPWVKKCAHRQKSLGQFLPV